MSSAYRDEPLFSTRCCIDGCDNEGTHVLGVRLRKPDFNLAAWAPNSAAYLCDECAKRGMRVQLVIDPIDRPEIEVCVASRHGPITRRVLLRDAAGE